MREVLPLAIAGAAGTLARYGLSSWTYRLCGDRFAYGTLVVNVAGCLLLGVALQAITAPGHLPAQWRTPITVGFFGAFTTFSTFGYETVRYLERGQLGLAAFNITASLVLCLAATFAGLTAGRALFGDGA